MKKVIFSLFFIISLNNIFSLDNEKNKHEKPKIKNSAVLDEYLIPNYELNNRYIEKFPIGTDKYYIYDDILWIPHMNLGIGFDNQTKTKYTDKQNHTWMSMYLIPSFRVGIFSFALNIPFRFGYIFDKDKNKNVITIDKSDWIPKSANDPGLNAAELYIPLIEYLNLGEDGDNLFFSLSRIENKTFGNGFIVDNYNNTNHYPNQKILGLQFDLDGNFFDFKYLGLELFASNIAYFDFFASRIYTRFLISESLKDMNIGLSLAFDRDPFYFAEKDIFNKYSSHYKTNIKKTTKVEVPKDDLLTLVWGLDIFIPVFSKTIKNNKLYTINITADFASQYKNYGGSFGIKGKIHSLFLYNLSFQFGGRGFIPSYFDRIYDIYKVEHYEATKQIYYYPTYAGIKLDLGFTFFSDYFSFGFRFDSPFKPDDKTLFYNPNFEVYLSLKEGLIGGLFASLTYKKSFIKNIEDFKSLKNTLISAELGYYFKKVDIRFWMFYKFNPGDFLYKNVVPSSFLANSGISIFWNVHLF